MIDPEFFTTAINYAPDPGFESGVRIHDFFASGGNQLPTISVVDTPVINGRYSLKIARLQDPAAAAGQAINHGYFIPIAPGETWAAAITCGFVTDDFDGGIVLAAISADRTSQIGAATQENTPAGQKEPLRIVHPGMTMPGDAAYLRVSLQLRGPAANVPGQAVFDDLVIAPAGTPLTPFGGNEGGVRFLGPEYFSLSQRAGEGQTMEVLRELVPPYWYSDPIDTRA